MGLEVTQVSFLYKPRNILKSLDNVGKNNMEIAY